MIHILHANLVFAVNKFIIIIVVFLEGKDF